MVQIWYVEFKNASLANINSLNIVPVKTNETRILDFVSLGATVCLKYHYTVVAYVLDGYQ